MNRFKSLMFVFTLVLMPFCISAQNSSFELLSSGQTGIEFANNIVENLTTKENLFDFDYFYNGAGVGIIDVNNDGLQDIYFAANQESNKLYLNEGNFKFRDITSSAFPNYLTKWSTGVSVVDINGDGWQDLYICQGGPYNPERRKNLLFINNGNNSFTESADEFGLADYGMSTQAVFFDLDKDGDLDCFVMNESLAYGLDPISFTRLNLEKKRELYESYSHMYINENGVYVDKTKEFGIDKPTFGLGIKLSDFNNDGWQDIYISNDYYVPDMMLINQKGNGFKDEVDAYLKQMSFYGMGLDIADINNDGLSDLFVLDMASGDHYRSKTLMRSMNTENFRLLVDGLQLPYQYMYNSLQLSNENLTYSNISQLAGVSSTDWSWSALLEDFDFDGLKDIHVTNGYRRYALDNDFQAKVRSTKRKYNDQVPLKVKDDLYKQMPTEKLQNIFYRNRGNLKFEELAFSSSDNPPSYSNGAAIADFDNDGDADLVINNLDSEAFLFKNLAVENQTNNFITFKQDHTSLHDVQKIQIELGESILSVEPSTVRGYLSSSESSAFMGLGSETKADKITVTWSDGTVSDVQDLPINKVHYLKYQNSGPKVTETDKGKMPADNISTYCDEIVPSSIGLNYTHNENDYDDFQKETLLPYKQSSLGPYVSASDINGDSLTDLLFSSSGGQPIRAFTQSEKGFEEYVFQNSSVLGNHEIGKITTTDIDKDGMIDIMLPSSGNEYEDGAEFYQSEILLSQKSGRNKDLKLPLTSGSTSNIIAIDYDKDGDVDIIECKRHIAQKYPHHAPSYLYKNVGLELVDDTDNAFPDLKTFGMINDMVVVDFNGDNWDDVVMIGEWSDIRFYQNMSGKFINVTSKYNIPSLKGMWFTIKAAELNGDDKVDFVIGNLGKNSKYKASKDNLLKIYGHDFDNNGTWDLVLSKEYKDNYVPLRGLECSSEQMPFIKDKFITYDLFASATLEDVYGSSLDSAYYRYVNTLSSITLLSGTNNTYEVVELPVEAQISPVLTIETHDVNSDGYEDVLIAGNIYDTEVETPRLDGGHGLVLINDSHGNFRAVKPQASGLDLNGNVKSMVKLFHKGGNCNLLIAVENNGPVRTFILNE